MALFTLSEFNPLNFTDDWKMDFQADVCYVQKFLSSDLIRLQYNISTDTTRQIVFKLTGESGSSEISQRLVKTTDEYNTYDVLLFGLNVGDYRLDIYNHSSVGSEYVILTTVFQVVPEFENSILLRYSNYRDDFGMAFEDYFYFRVEGVFLPAGKSHGVNAESFRDQQYVTHQLSAFPYRVETLTVGGEFGVPEWVGNKLNLIFSMSEVDINGVDYVRSDDATPEMVPFHADYPLFVYQLAVEKQNAFITEIELDPPRPIVTERGNYVYTPYGSQVFV